MDVLRLHAIQIRLIICILLLIPAFLGPFGIPEGPCIASHLVINEFEQNPEGPDSGNEWIELYNPTTADVNTLAWKIETSAGERQTHQMGEATVPARGFLTIAFLSLFLNNVDESIKLIDRNGNLVDFTPPVSDTWNDQRSWQRIPDGLESAAAWKFIVNTKGSSNAATQPETGPSPYCGLSTRIGLATSAAVLAFAAVPVAMLMPLPPWKKEAEKKEDVRKGKGTESESTRLPLYLFAITLGLLIFELWEKMRIPELADIIPLTDTIISVTAILAGAGGVVTFLIQRHSTKPAG